MLGKLFPNIFKSLSWHKVLIFYQKGILIWLINYSAVWEQRPSQGTLNGGAVSKWPRCRWDVKHNQSTNQPCSITKKSGTGIQDSTLVIDPRRSFECMSPETVPHTTQAALLNSYPNACMQYREAVSTIFLMANPLSHPDKMNVDVIADSTNTT